MFTGLDVNVAHYTATNAVENNFAIAIQYFIVAAFSGTALCVYLETPEGREFLRHNWNVIKHSLSNADIVKFANTLDKHKEADAQTQEQVLSESQQRYFKYIEDVEERTRAIENARAELDGIERFNAAQRAEEQAETAKQAQRQPQSLSSTGMPDPDDWNKKKNIYKPQKIKNGPDFPNLKIHANKHSKLHTNAYYNQAVKHTQTGKRFLFRHDGQNKILYVTRAGKNGEDALFNITSTSRNGKVIFTHIQKVTEQYLRKKGITLPKGF